MKEKEFRELVNDEQTVGDLLRSGVIPPPQQLPITKKLGITYDDEWWQCPRCNAKFESRRKLKVHCVQIHNATFTAIEKVARRKMERRAKA